MKTECSFFIYHCYYRCKRSPLLFCASHVACIVLMKLETTVSGAMKKIIFNQMLSFSASLKSKNPPEISTKVILSFEEKSVILNYIIIRFLLHKFKLLKFNIFQFQRLLNWRCLHFNISLLYLWICNVYIFSFFFNWTTSNFKSYKFE